MRTPAGAVEASTPEAAPNVRQAVPFFLVEDMAVEVYGDPLAALARLLLFFALAAPLISASAASVAAAHAPTTPTTHIRACMRPSIGPVAASLKTPPPAG